MIFTRSGRDDRLHLRLLLALRTQIRCFLFLHSILFHIPDESASLPIVLADILSIYGFLPIPISLSLELSSMLSPCSLHRPVDGWSTLASFEITIKHVLVHCRWARGVSAVSQPSFGGHSEMPSRSAVVIVASGLESARSILRLLPFLPSWTLFEPHCSRWTTVDSPSFPSLSVPLSLYFSLSSR